MARPFFFLMLLTVVGFGNGSGKADFSGGLGMIAITEVDAFVLVCLQIDGVDNGFFKVGF